MNRFNYLLKNFKKINNMDIKTKLDIAKQKVTGIAQQVKGEVEVASGQQIKGNLNKVSGKVKEVIADVRNKLEKNK